jgi:hypothetical protein
MTLMSTRSFRAVGFSDATHHHQLTNHSLISPLSRGWGGVVWGGVGHGIVTSVNGIWLVVSHEEGMMDRLDVVRAAMDRKREEDRQEWLEWRRRRAVYDKRRAGKCRHTNVVDGINSNHDAVCLRCGRIVQAG